MFILAGVISGKMKPNGPQSQFQVAAICTGNISEKHNRFSELQQHSHLIEFVIFSSALKPRLIVFAEVLDLFQWYH